MVNVGRQVVHRDVECKRAKNDGLEKVCGNEDGGCNLYGGDGTAAAKSCKEARGPGLNNALNGPIQSHHAAVSYPLGLPCGASLLLACNMLCLQDE